MIVRWEQGRAIVDDLIEEGRIEQVEASPRLARLMIEQATTADVRDAIPLATAIVDVAEQVIATMPRY